MLISYGFREPVPAPGALAGFVILEPPDDVDVFGPVLLYEITEKAPIYRDLTVPVALADRTFGGITHATVTDYLSLPLSPSYATGKLYSRPSPVDGKSGGQIGL